MLKSRYKFLQLLGLFAGFSILTLPIIFSLKKGHSTPGGIPMASILSFLIVYFFYIYFKLSPRVSFDERSITTRVFFTRHTYDWDEVTEVWMSKKHAYTVFGIFRQYLEGTAICFENGNKLILWDDVYGNLPDMRLFIESKVKSKIQDPAPEVKMSTIQFMESKKYAGNPFTSINSLMIAGTIVLFFVLLNNNTRIDRLLLILLGFTLVLYLFLGMQMNYFIIEQGMLVVRNHYFPWKQQSFYLQDIKNVTTETPPKRSQGLRVVT
ncbi:MAG: hypothetical protein J7497_16365, partial [Chitinophagaceae bacterium]|nr:hypothetical protein [Chitinophagaceae bacterium]